MNFQLFGDYFMFIFMKILLSIIFFLMGAVVFSYLNLIIKALPVNGNIIRLHHTCLLCGHEQSTGDSFPIFSYFRYKGKCRYCNGSIPLRPLFTEILGGILMVICELAYGISVETFFVFLVICDLTVISFIDADTQEIPLVLNIILFILGIASVWIIGEPCITDRVIGIFAISLPMFLLAVLFNGFGGGDVKLMAAAGFLLGWKAVVAAFFFAVIAGGAYAVYLLATKKKGRKGYFAFGPFLCVGIFLALINNNGTRLVQMYVDYLLYWVNGYFW